MAMAFALLERHDDRTNPCRSRRDRCQPATAEGPVKSTTLPPPGIDRLSIVGNV